MRRTLTCMLFLAGALASFCQQDTLRGPVRFGWTDPPPVMNVVEAGLELERSAARQSASWWLALGGALVGGVFHLADNPAAGNVALGLGATGFVVWQVRSVKPLRKAGQWLQQGWDPRLRYEALPDSVGMAAPVERERVIQDRQ